MSAVAFSCHRDTAEVPETQRRQNMSIKVFGNCSKQLHANESLLGGGRNACRENHQDPPACDWRQPRHRELQRVPGPSETHFRASQVENLCLFNTYATWNNFLLFLGPQRVALKNLEQRYWASLNCPNCSGHLSIASEIIFTECPTCQISLPPYVKTNRSQ